MAFVFRSLIWSQRPYESVPDSEQLLVEPNDTSIEMVSISDEDATVPQALGTTVDQDPILYDFDAEDSWATCRTRCHFGSWSIQNTCFSLFGILLWFIRDSIASFCNSMVLATMGVVPGNKSFIRRLFFRLVAYTEWYRLVAIILLFELLSGFALTYLAVGTVASAGYLSWWLGFRKLVLITLLLIILVSPHFWFWTLTILRHMVLKRHDSMGAAKVSALKHVKGGPKFQVKGDKNSRSHPKTSSTRNAFFTFAKKWGDKLKCTPYALLRSRRMWDEGFIGTSYSILPEHCIINDPYLANEDNDPIPENPLFVLCDRDYYTDMNLLLSHGDPVLMYTFTPDHAAYHDEETSYCFLKDGTVSGSVMGAQQWAHALWEYPEDMLRVSRYGILWTYKVIRYRVDRDRSCVLLLPVSFTFSTVSCKLKRSTNVHGLTTIINHGDEVDIGQIGSYTSHRMKTTHWAILLDGLLVRHTMSGVSAITSQDIEKRLRTMCGYSNEMIAANLMWIETALRGLDDSYAGSDWFDLKFAPTVHEKPIVYECIDEKGRGDDELLKPPMVSLTDCMVTPSVVPVTKALGNIATSIEQRVVKPQNAADKIAKHFPAGYLTYVMEFAELLLNGKKLIPLSEEETGLRMDRPDQRADRIRSETIAFPNDVSTQFIKNEAYGEINDPRSITQKKGPEKWQFARYVYAMSEHLKQLPWFAGGKTPRQIAERVTATAVMARELGLMLAITDFSRFDGTVNIFTRLFIWYIYRSAFYENEHELLEFLLDARVDEKVFADIICYMTGFAQCSGDQNTSVLGTLVNAFITYVALREQGYSHSEAWKMLGVYLGDDGNTPCKDPKVVMEVAKKCGHNLTIEPVKVGEGIQFLSRYYSPSVWFGCPDSCLDFKRQLSKFHLTANTFSVQTLMGKAHKLWMKAYAVVLNDASTPVMGEYCSLIIRAFEPLKFSLPPFKTLEDYHNKVGRSDDAMNYYGVLAHVFGNGFPNVNYMNWMEAKLMESCPGFDIFQFKAWLRKVTRDVETLLRDPNNPLFLELVYGLISHFPKFGDFCTTVTVDKPGMHVVLTQDGNREIVRPEGPCRTPLNCEPSKLNVSTKDDLDAAKAYMDLFLAKGPWPFEDLPAGSKKCLYVATRFIQAVLKQRKDRNVQAPGIFLYTGSMGLTDKYVARLLNILLPDLTPHFFDPGYAEKLPEVKERLGQDVKIRATSFTKKIFDSLKNERYIYWLDDMYAEPAEKSLMALRVDILKNATNVHLASIKVHGFAGERELMEGTMYHTSSDAPFEAVNEHRLEFDGDTRVKRSTYDILNATPVPAFSMVKTLAWAVMVNSPGKPPPKQEAGSKPNTKGPVPVKSGKAPKGTPTVHSAKIPGDKPNTKNTNPKNTQPATKVVAPKGEKVKKSVPGSDQVKARPPRQTKPNQPPPKGARKPAAAGIDQPKAQQPSSNPKPEAPAPTGTSVPPAGRVEPIIGPRLRKNKGRSLSK